jgi:hypothetical protein
MIFAFPRAWSRAPAIAAAGFTKEYEAATDRYTAAQAWGWLSEVFFERFFRRIPKET